ncbi:MAG: Bax inhibitor-1/YccA family protein [Bacteroidales bacterium]|nr:Bax inhibitor-1/YccA family protein [Bacteroidales bacterium]
MRFGKSSNPVLSKKRFENTQVFAQTSSEPMTLNGTLNKTLILFGLLLVTGTFAWNLTKTASFNPMVLIIGGAIGGLVLAIFTVMKPEKSPITAPIYALLEGLFVGALSAMYDTFLDGIVMQAIGLTLSILFIMLVLYRSGILKATPKFKKGVFIATGGVAFFYIINLIAGFMGGGISLFNLGWTGIGISLVIVVIAAMNLIIDFDMIETGINSGQPKYIEWYASFGLMVTLIWLYIEILRLLALLANRS